MALTPPALLVSRAQVTRYESLLERRRRLTAERLAKTWRDLGAWNADQVPGFERLAQPILQGAKTQTVAASNAFNSRALGVPPQPISAARVLVEADLRQPFTAHWHSLKMGNTWADALESGEIAADQVGDRFVHSVARVTGDHVTESAGLRDVRWARVPSPNACDWCQMVAGERYLSAESADFGHTPCHCAVVPGS
jgi:hypothetical protein